MSPNGLTAATKASEPPLEVAPGSAVPTRPATNMWPAASKTTASASSDPVVPNWLAHRSPPAGRMATM